MTEETTLLSLRDVVKSYGTQKVLEIDDLKIQRGQSIALFGGNASGKSTLMRILCGISIVDRGEVFRHPRLERRHLGYLPQSGGLYGDLTLRENLRLRRRLYGLIHFPPEGLWYVDELGLDRFLDRQVSQLSGGYQRLAALATMLHSEPRWLLMDEPLSGVDQRATEVLERRFEKLRKSLELCVVATPSGDRDLGMAERIEVRQGRIV